MSDTKTKKTEEAKQEKYYTVTRSKEDKHKAVISITIPEDAVKRSYDKMIAQEMSKLNIKGFRKGTAPKEMFENGMKPQVMASMFDQLAPYYVQGAVMKEGLKPVAPAKYLELKDFPNEPKAITFEVEIIEMPDFKIGDLKKVKIELESPEATKEDIQKTLENLMQQFPASDESKEVNDAWAKETAAKVGFKAENLKDFEEEVAQVIREQKMNYAVNKGHEDLVAKSIEASGIVIPQEAVDFEYSQREKQFMDQVQELGLTVKEFCKRNNVELKDLEARWETESKNALESDVFLRLFAQDRKVEVTEEELATEIDRVRHSRAQMKDNNEAMYQNPEWVEYIRGIVLKRKSYDTFVKEVMPKELQKLVDELKEKQAEAQKAAIEAQVNAAADAQNDAKEDEATEEVKDSKDDESKESAPQEKSKKESKKLE